MKAKNQQNYTSELDAKEKLIVYVYEYLIHSNAKQAAELFKESIGYQKDIKVNDSPGFLMDWWCVFWDLYCAAPDRRHNQPESTSDARAFHDFMRQTPMSPSITQTSPPQHPQQPPQFAMGPGVRYGPPPPNQGGGPRGPPRMPGPSQHGPHPGGPPPGAFMPTGSPRYAQHSGPPPGPPQGPPPPHMSQSPMFVGVPGPDQMGPSPGLNRMTPVSAPPQQVVGPPGVPNGPPHGPPQGPPQMVGMPVGQQQMGPGPGQGQPQQVVNSMPGGPPRNGSQGSAQGGWPPQQPQQQPQQQPPQGNINYNVNSPANQQSCYTGGPGSNQGPNQGGPGGPIMMPDGTMMEVKSSPVNGADPMGATPHSDEYVMPNAVPFGQETSDQCESAEIMKLKQSMQEDTTKMFDKEQSEFGLADYSDSQTKWS